MTMDTTELSSFFDEVELDAHRFALYADGAHASFSARERFDTLVREYQEKAQQGQGDPLRAAVGQFSDGDLCTPLLACYTSLGKRSSDCRNCAQTSKYLVPPTT